MFTRVLASCDAWLSEAHDGQGLIEYALIITFVAVALVAALAAFAGGLSGAYGAVTGAL